MSSSAQSRLAIKMISRREGTWGGGDDQDEDEEDVEEEDHDGDGCHQLL